MSQEWDIKPRGDACTVCETAFADGQSYVSALVFTEEAGYARRDCCESCWKERQPETAPFSTWRGVFEMPPPPAEEPFKKENAESLLRKLMEDEDEANLNAIYILAVMLERKRMLVEKAVQTRDDGVLIRVYEYRKTGETFLIPDPQLQLDQLEDIQDEVALLLGAKPRTVEPNAEEGSPVAAGEEGAADVEEDDEEEEEFEDDNDEEDE